MPPSSRRICACGDRVFESRTHPGEVPGKENNEMDITTDVVTVLHPAAEDVAQRQRITPRLTSL
jgi:hypothetical protein